jgi:hypothetical protein
VYESAQRIAHDDPMMVEHGLHEAASCGGEGLADRDAP